jgi:aspartate kinase
MIVHNSNVAGGSEISFTVPTGDLAKTLELSRTIARSIGAESVDHSTDVAKVSVVGLGMRTHSGVAQRLFQTLAKNGVNILMITTSEIKISVLVNKADAVAALRAVHAEFELDKPFPEVKDPVIKIRTGFEPLGGVTAEDRMREIAGTLPNLEDILVSAVEADRRQGRVTIFNVPDRPGFAGMVFSRVAEAGVPVDMIVQNAGADGSAQISFTVLRGDLEEAAKAAQTALREVGGGNCKTDPGMVKISVRGVGMRTHTGVACRMFRALAAEKVNIELINTSELHITVVVDESQADQAVATLRKEFQLGD